MIYLIELGHSPRLASLEIDQLITASGHKYSKTYLSSKLLVVETRKADVLPLLKARVGGSVRISPVVCRLDGESSLLSQIGWIAKRNGSRKFTFALHHVGGQTTKQELGQIKAHLAQLGLASRFIESAHGFTQPIVWHQHQVFEFITFEHQGKLLLAQTAYVTDVKAWQYRDRNRPKVDGQSGVLPPKVSRILCNIAYPHTGRGELLDPFCGSGTIVMEAALLGHAATGVDVSPKAVADSITNLKWLEEQTGEKLDYKILELDTSEALVSTFGTKRFDAIVTEAYLGPSKFESGQIDAILAQLSQLYTKCLVQMFDVLKDGGRLVIALPEFPKSKSSVSFHQGIIDTIAQTGYTQHLKSLEYSQEGARVVRKIYILDKKV